MAWWRSQKNSKDESEIYDDEKLWEWFCESVCVCVCALCSMWLGTYDKENHSVYADINVVTTLPAPVLKLREKLSVEIRVSFKTCYSNKVKHEIRNYSYCEIAV